MDPKYRRIKQSVNYLMVVTPTWRSLTLSPPPPLSTGSATSEDLFWKLDALQMFVLDLHWPEPEFAKHLEQRLKLMASDMMEACVKRSRPLLSLLVAHVNVKPLYFIICIIFCDVNKPVKTQPRRSQSFI